MDLETQIATLNAYFFFYEFAFSKNTFTPPPSSEVELADNIIWLEETLFAFQLKERVEEGTPEEEEKWFKSKILKDAKSQVSDTIKYLKAYPKIDLKNHRGQTFYLHTKYIKHIFKAIIYKPGKHLPLHCRQLKFYRSQISGFIHLFSHEDYIYVIKTFQTIPELADYLSFREKLIASNETAVAVLPEVVIVGQYVSGNLDAAPDIAFEVFAKQLQNDRKTWDMSDIIKVFPEQTIEAEFPTHYVRVIAELAKLKRNELKAFKTRFYLCADKVEANIPTRPYRFTTPRTGCGFVFIPLTKEMLPYRRDQLKSLCGWHKYEMKLPRCVAVDFSLDNGKFFSCWCHMDFPWTESKELEKSFSSFPYPFRPVRTSQLPLYEFGDDPTK